MTLADISPLLKDFVRATKWLERLQYIPYIHVY